MKTSAALALVLALASPGAAQVRIETGFLDRTVELPGGIYRYQVYVPAEYTPERAWPVIMDLHGNGAQGTDGMFQTTGRNATPIRAERDRYPVLVVFPQAQPGTRWIDPAMQDMAMAELEQTMREFKVDPDRVYLTGFSMGGTGVYHFAARWPDRFAALMTVAGRVERSARQAAAEAEAPAAGETPSSARAPAPAQEPAGPASESADVAPGKEFAAIAEKIKHLPLWVFHGSADESVPVEQSRKMTAVLRALGSRVRYTEYAGGTHQGAWGRAYADPQTTAWLLMQRRRVVTPQ